MVNLPKLTEANIAGKRVIVRADLDFDPNDTSNLRLVSLLPTLDFIKEKGSKIILIGHRGRPEGKVDEGLSLTPFKKIFEKYNPDLAENLRFDKGEEENSGEFAKKLASLGDFFVNEAFAVSHRKHASIVTLPKLLPHAAGFRFEKEVENLSHVLVSPTRPIIIIISGLKDDKLTYLEDFLKFSDKVLIGGRLPDYVHDVSPLRKNEKVIVADLIGDKEDITIHSVEKFETAIKTAGTTVVSGPIGKYEEEGHRLGTKRIFESVANSNAFKVAGGGDTESAIKLFNLENKFNWISVGGGAMLEFLAKGTLPGIDALIE
ncbi:MAG TPA: phosphoglycerate kinase [Candidatus Saccharimonadales bacterium]|nr:phosphoglycerate kinase [Candidatus Saccharimonadales bacterium]